MLGASFFRWRGLTTIPPLTPFLSTWSQCGATITKAYGWSPRWRPANTSNFCDGSDWPRCVLSALWGMCRCFAYPRPAGMNPRSAGYVEPGQVELPRPLMVCPRLWQTPLSDWLMRWNRFLTLCLTVDDSLPQLLDRRRVASVLRLFPGAAHIQRLVADRLLFGRRLHAFECRLRVESVDSRSELADSRLSYNVVRPIPRWSRPSQQGGAEVSLDHELTLDANGRPTAISL